MKPLDDVEDLRAQATIVDAGSRDVLHRYGQVFSPCPTCHPASVTPDGPQIAGMVTGSGPP